MPSPPSTRPSDARGRRSFAFAREDSGRIRGFEQRSALQAGNILPVREFRFCATCEVSETAGDFRFLRCCGLILLTAKLSHFDPELPSLMAVLRARLLAGEIASVSAAGASLFPAGLAQTHPA